MKSLGIISDADTCNMIYDLHTTIPILQEEEERQGKILDADYSKVDIDGMVNGLDIARATKTKLKQTLNKFPTLFGGGLCTLKMRPIDIELQEGAKSYAGRFYNIPKTYEKMAKTEV